METSPTRTATVRGLRRSWSSLAAPEPRAVVGDLRAEFVAPLTTVAPAGLGLVGLPRWWGKRFREVDGAVDGVNLLRPRTGTGPLEEVLPMRLREGRSLADGLPALVVQYDARAPRPWRWVRDELRPGPEPGVWVGMTYVDRPGLRRAGTPFLLRAGHGEG